MGFHKVVHYLTCEMQPEILSYKVSVLGDTGVGKSTFIRRHLDGEYLETHVPTLGVEVHPLTFQITSATCHNLPTKVCLNMWDVAGNDRFGGIRGGYTLNSDAAIVMVDPSAKKPRIDYWLNLLDHVPVVLCSTKCDERGTSFAHLQTEALPIVKAFRARKTFGQVQVVSLYEISSRSNYNFEKPFLALLRHLLQTPDLMFAETPIQVGAKL
jgi:GTP-binding nuclear protein Ran